MSDAHWLISTVRHEPSVLSTLTSGGQRREFENALSRARLIAGTECVLVLEHGHRFAPVESLCVSHGHVHVVSMKDSSKATRATTEFLQTLGHLHSFDSIEELLSSPALMSTTESFVWTITPQDGQVLFVSTDGHKTRQLSRRSIATALGTPDDFDSDELIAYPQARRATINAKEVMNMYDENNSAQAQNVVLIEGLSASGKTTLCRHLAAMTGGTHVPSGLYFCSLATTLEEADLSKVVDQSGVMFELLREKIQQLLPLAEGVATEAIRSRASEIAAIPHLWELVMRKVRNDVAQIASSGGTVFVDGRGLSEVWTDRVAGRIFLTASALTRKRRLLQRWKAGGSHRTFALVHGQTVRDDRDSGRRVGATQPALDAITINTDKLSVDAIGVRVLALLAGSDSFAGKLASSARSARS